jgi:WD40 repeat protein
MGGVVLAQCLPKECCNDGTSCNVGECHICCADERQSDDKWSVECLVQKVVVHRRQQVVPTIRWLAGQRETLVVELAVIGGQGAARTTSCGSKLETQQTNNMVGQEVWVWGDSITTDSGVAKYKGEPLEFEVKLSTQMRLRVYGGMTGWTTASGSREMLGEVRFKISDDVLPCESQDGALSLPLVQDSRVQGTAWLTTKLRRTGLWDSGGTFSVKSLPSGQMRLVRLKAHRGPVTACAAFPDNRRVLTVSTDTTGIIWSSEGLVLSQLEGHASALVACGVFPSGEQVLTVAEDATSVIWSSAGMQLATLGGARLCSIFPSGNKILAGTGANMGTIFSASGEQLAALRGHTRKITACAVFPDEQHVLTCSEDDESIIWSVHGDTVRVLRAHTDAVISCAISDCGRIILTGSNDKTALVWSSMDKTPLHHLRGHHGPVTRCVFATGSQLLTGGDDGLAIVWSANGELLAKLSDHKGPVKSCLAFPMKAWLLTVSADKTGIIWSNQGQMLGQLQGHAGGINSCALFKDGQRIVTASDDHTGLIWPVHLFLDVRECGYR